MCNHVEPLIAIETINISYYKSLQSGYLLGIHPSSNKNLSYNIIIESCYSLTLHTPSFNLDVANCATVMWWDKHVQKRHCTEREMNEMKKFLYDGKKTKEKKIFSRCLLTAWASLALLEADSSKRLQLYLEEEKMCERERESENKCEREWESVRESVRESMYERECVREWVCERMCEREWESKCVREGERECVRESMRVWECVRESMREWECVRERVWDF